MPRALRRHGRRRSGTCGRARAQPTPTDAMQRSFAAAGNLRRLLAYAWAERRALALVLSLTCLSAALAGLQPWPLKILIDHGLAGAAIPDAMSAALAAAGLEAT